MKKFTHAWLAFMAVKRLDEIKFSSSNQKYATNLIEWFRDHNDDVIQGAWYPDAVIKDMANSHVLKLTPSDSATNKFKYLSTTYLNYQTGKIHPLHDMSFMIEKDDNLPDRCESITHSVIDNMKMLQSETKGSPVTPTNNHVALILFMLSHYVADAHVPFHCDSRRFSEGANIHGRAEDEWEDLIKHFYQIDVVNERFYYDKNGYPLRDPAANANYPGSILEKVEDELKNRKFYMGWGRNNNNVWDFMSAICQYSYLLSYDFIPNDYDHTNVTSANWKTLGNQPFEDYSVAVLSDAIDSIARVWFRGWRKYMQWKK